MINLFQSGYGKFNFRNNKFLIGQLERIIKSWWSVWNDGRLSILIEWLIESIISDDFYGETFNGRDNF
jgi:hypothetical protein